MAETPAATADWDRLKPLAERAVALGRTLFQLDLAATLARAHVEAAPTAPGVDDWIVDLGPQGYRVVFTRGDHPPRAVYAVSYAADGAPVAQALDWQALDARAAAMWTAARTVRASGLAPAGVATAVLVIPPETHGGGIEAYLMRRGPSPGDVVIGVHWRLELSGDGRTLLAREPLSRSDLVLPGFNGQPPADVAVTHLLGDAPSEVHVYLSLKHDMALDVITPSSSAEWRVEGEGITLTGWLAG